MADISKVTLPSGTVYNIKDEVARNAIAELEGYTEFLGVTTTSITDGATTNPVVINGASVTAKKGDIVTYQSKEFIFNGTAWQEFGDLSGLGALAYKDSASGTVKAAGSVSQPTFAGDEMTASGAFTPKGSVTIAKGTGAANYTPEGSVSAPAVQITPSTATVNSINSVGSLPAWTATVADETLTIGWNAGSLPTKGSNQVVLTGIESATASAPSFTGTGVHLDGTFAGTSETVSVKGTPSGTVSKPSFTGSNVNVTVS